MKYNLFGSGEREWKSRWIWLQSSDGDANSYTIFRKNIVIDSEIKSAELCISAETRYKLYVNGEFAGRGSCPANPRYYDTHDVSVLLKKGVNTIAVQVHYYGYSTFFNDDAGKAGLLLQLEIHTPASVYTVTSNSTWLCRKDDAYRQCPLLGYRLGFQEHYDARNELGSWWRNDFNDEKWEFARELGKAGADPWGIPVRRDIPFMDESGILSPKLVWIKETLNSGEANPGRAIPREVPKPLNLCHADILDAKAVDVEIQTCKSMGISLLLDFGRTVSGYLMIETEGRSGAYIDIAYAEKLNSLGTVWSDLWADDRKDDPWTARWGLNAYGDKYYMKNGLQSWESFEWRGFRYAQLTFRNADEKVRLISLRLRESWYPLSEKGFFKCSDEGLNSLMDMGQLTTRLCMHENIMDCCTRERAQWWGDAVNIQRGLYYSYADTLLFAKGARQIAFSQDSDGRLHCPAPGAFKLELPCQMMYYIIGLKDYYMYTGDKDLLTLLYPSVNDYMAYLAKKSDRTGLLNMENWDPEKTWFWIDWSPTDKNGSLAALNAFYSLACEAMASMAEALEFGEELRYYNHEREKMNHKINSFLWDDGFGAYCDSFHDGVRSKSFTEMVNALCLLCGAANEAQTGKILENVFDASKQVIRSSPYFKMFYYEALLSIGKPDMVMNDINASFKVWSNALLPTLPELFEYQKRDRDSLAHAWSAVCNYILPAYFGGIRPTKPGFDEFILSPNMIGIDSIDIEVPTTKGMIRCGLVLEGEHLKVDLSVPEGCRWEFKKGAGYNSWELSNDRFFKS